MLQRLGRERGMVVRNQPCAIRPDQHKAVARGKGGGLAVGDARELVVAGDDHALFAEGMNDERLQLDLQGCAERVIEIGPDLRRLRGEVRYCPSVPQMVACGA